MQASHAIWKRKIIVAPPPKKTKAVKTQAPVHRKKQTVEKLLELDESEVELDSLGLFFMQLIDTDSSHQR